MPKIINLRDVYVEQLKDLYNAEQQLIKALPKMAKAASNPDLAQGFEEHLEQTKGHANRLEEIFKKLEEKPTGKKCKAMEGLIKEGAEAIEEDATDAARDALLIAAAQRVEHYEIAGYGSVRTYADLLGDGDAVKLLGETLQEEKDTDEKLTDAAESINPEAQAAGEEGRGGRRKAAPHDSALTGLPMPRPAPAYRRRSRRGGKGSRLFPLLLSSQQCH
ncbi:MAG: ferritin-like domain-containing protein [Verrucomicrobiota bacterium]